MIQEISVKHNVEMAHRLTRTPGKCEAIHGHSWWVELQLRGTTNRAGLLNGIEYGFLKSEFRGYLDKEFDHRLVLNEQDPWASDFAPYDKLVTPPADDSPGPRLRLPGLAVVKFDPTTENFAMHLYNHFRQFFNMDCRLVVWETSVNCATVGDW